MLLVRGNAAELNEMFRGNGQAPVDSSGGRKVALTFPGRAL